MTDSKTLIDSLQSYLSFGYRRVQPSGSAADNLSIEYNFEWGGTQGIKEILVTLTEDKNKSNSIQIGKMHPVYAQVTRVWSGYVDPGKYRLELRAIAADNRELESIEKGIINLTQEAYTPKINAEWSVSRLRRTDLYKITVNSKDNVSSGGLFLYFGDGIKYPLPRAVTRNTPYSAVINLDGRSVSDLKLCDTGNNLMKRIYGGK